ncbi:FMRFamide receptor isoform X2 [Eurytemora carolleeae]|uniref:FMRFamide receptor isoform X2 n=1 Tax=Eurytemora carolleeae TaxID=1294199 RepID=UPI000C7773B9|nr:FMRFamide receptor isoform X2 [Eurytemora carolleeae]|eukprot:XP_023320601.1 FMRFamide receptor-like isoform X2 [Eurytemora affinis]
MDLIFLLEGVIMLPTALMGMALNIASIFYFARYHHQRPFHRLLMTLAGVDTCYLLTSSLSFSLKSISQTYRNTVWNLIVPYTLPIAQTTMTASVYLTISLTIERYFSVVKPFYQLRNRWLRSSLILAIPGLVFSLVFTLPNYFMIRTVWSKVPVYGELPEGFQLNQTILSQWNASSPFFNTQTASGANMTLVRAENETLLVTGERLQPDIELASFRDNEIYIKVYVMWLHFIFNSILPLSILLTLNTAIYRKLSTCVEQMPGQLRRSTEGHLRRRELRLARISLLIVFIFVLCHTPKVFPSAFEICGQDPHMVPTLVEFSHLLLTVNSSVNFLVYYLACGKHVCHIFRHRAINRNFQMSQREHCTMISQISEPALHINIVLKRENGLLITETSGLCSSAVEDTEL